MLNGNRGVNVHTRTVGLIVAIALALAACAAESIPAAVDESTTTLAASTTEAPTTTTSPASSTTTASEQATTTTEATEIVPSEVDELFELLASAPEVTSGRMEGSIEIEGLDPSEAGVSDASIIFSSAFDAATGDGSFLMDFSSLEEAVDVDEDDPWSALAGGLLGTMEFRQVGDRAYMNAPFFGLLLGAETTWISMPADDGAELSSGFETVPSDPDEILDAYGDASATVEELGVEQVNGTTATHYRITFDTSAMIAELTPEERAELEASGVFAEGILPMDLWVTDEGHLVRMVLEIDGSSATTAPGESFESMRIRYDIYDIGADITITPPPADEVTPIEDLEDLTFDFGLDA
jgi:hypothetical protein